MNNDDDKLEGIDKMGVKDELFINDDIANEKKMLTKITLASYWRKIKF